jgi:hypothetical protein
MLGFVACNENEIFEKELYKKVIGLLSNDDKVFAIEHDLNEETSTGYISVSCGGSRHIEEDILVTIEPDNELLDRYNRLQFDTATTQYAQYLPEWRYEIPRMNTTLEAGSPDSYSKIEIKITPDGLSPDSAYMIPLRIKSVSSQEVNAAKNNVLYQVYIKNSYARQVETTYYKMKGTKFEDGSSYIHPTPVSVDKIFYPISKNRVRTLAGLQAFAEKKATLNEIDLYGIILEVNEDSTVNIRPCGSLALEITDDPESNRYEEYETTGYGQVYKNQVFYLSYKYWGYSNSLAKYTWINMKETCVRQQINF